MLRHGLAFVGGRKGQEDWLVVTGRGEDTADSRGATLVGCLVFFFLLGEARPPVFPFGERKVSRRRQGKASARTHTSPKKVLQQGTSGTKLEKSRVMKKVSRRPRLKDNLPSWLLPLRRHKFARLAAPALLFSGTFQRRRKSFRNSLSDRYRAIVKYEHWERRYNINSNFDYGV